MIDYDEFFEFIDETKTPFSEGLFRMIDADSNGTVGAFTSQRARREPLQSTHVCMSLVCSSDRL